MPRKARKFIGSAFTHNMVQGINKEYIFQKHNQKLKYILTMNKYSEKHNILIIAYCIMDNHAHILTYSENINDLSIFMKKTNTEYAKYYNKTQNRVGFVFRNRFDSKTIYNQEYLLQCIKYIHMNPVKSKVVKAEEEYEYSSYRNYLDNTKINSKILNLVFNSSENYIKEFQNIKYAPLNFEKEDVDLQKVLQKYCQLENINLSQIQKNNILVKKFISYLISNEYKFTKIEIAKILKISRGKLYRILS